MFPYGSLDGELIIEGKEFNEISSAIMSEDGEPDFKYVIFDALLEADYSYLQRFGFIPINNRIETVDIHNARELLVYETYCLDRGYEGVMIRSVDGKYKQGRSTVKEGILLKLKRFVDSEAKIIGFVEQMKNENEIEQDATGKNKRGRKKDFLVPKNTLGALEVVDIHSGVEFEIATGFSDELRKRIWDNQPSYMGNLVKYKSQTQGALHKPRFPVFLGFRHEEDL